jgi:hypothetical protein
MTTIGTDCHVALTHPKVNSGLAYGFLLDAPDDLGPAVSLQRQVDAAGTITVRIFFKAFLADDMVNPDGTPHSAGKAAMYAMLTQYLAQTDGITVEAAVGVFSNCGAQGHSATEMHYLGLSIVACQLNNVGVYWPPADASLFYNSTWDSILTWATSYWR